MLIPTTLQALDELPGRLRDEVVIKHQPRPVLALDPAHVVAAVGGSPFVRDNSKELVVACVAIKILRRVRPESSRRPPRHRRDTCSMAWRYRFLTARRNQRGQRRAPDTLVDFHTVGDDVRRGDHVEGRLAPRPVWTSTSELGYGHDVASMAWNRHAIEQTQLRRRHCVDGVGRPKFDVHTARDPPLEKKAPAMWPSAPVMFTSLRTGRIAFVSSFWHKASKSMPSGALGGAWRCVLRSNFSIHTWSSILPDAARVKDFKWTCVDGVAVAS